MGLCLVTSRVRPRLCAPESQRPIQETDGRRARARLVVVGMAEAGIEPSVGSVGDSCGNAPAETINGLYKTELVHRQGPWCNMQDLEIVTLGRVDWFNHRRLPGPIGNIPPAEAEDNLHAQRDVLEMVAWNEATEFRL